MAEWELNRPEGLPLPQPDEEAEPFFAALLEQKLLLQRCAQCGQLSHPPRMACAQCHSFDFEWSQASGRGTVYSYAVTHQPIHPALIDHTPFATVQIELAEGPHMTSNLTDVPPNEVEIGMAVEVVFDRITDEVTLPLFRRA